MTKPNGDSFLPHVEDIDITQVLFEDIVDPSHRARFERLAQTNPEIVQEIIRRAYISASELSSSSVSTTVEAQKMIIDNVTFALSALEASLRRLSSDDGDDEVPPRSSAPDGDQPAL